MIKSRKHLWRDTIVVAAAGLILGLFFSRVLAEIAWVRWPFYRIEWTLAGAALVGAALTAVWRVRPGGIAPASLLPCGLLALYLIQPMPNLVQAGVLFAGVLLLVGVSNSRRPFPDWGIALGLFFVPLAFYLSTLTPGVGERDGYELQAVSATLGYAHPTGYPLFPIVGRIWIAIFPFGGIAWRINVLCALYASASIPLIYGLARRVLGRQSFAAWSASCLAFSRTLWAQAAQPEKYTLNAFFVALTLYVAFGAVDPRSRGPHPHLRWLAFVYGLSLTHHRTMLMLAPALALYVLWRDPGLLKRPAEWLTALGVALAPLLIYLYIPWRACAQGVCMSAGEFIQYISGAYYSPAIHPFDWLAPERAQMFWRFLLTQFGYPGIVLGALGVITWAVRRQWTFLICSALAYFTYYLWGTIWYAYYNDVNSFIPNHLIFVVWMGRGALGVWQLIRRLAGRVSGLPLQAARSVLFAVLILLPLGMIWRNAPQVDRRDAWGLTRWAEYAIAQDLAPNAVILADREKHPPLDYLSRVEGRRPDLDVVILGDEQAYLDRLLWDLAHGKTVYLARFLPGLDGPYHLYSAGPLVEVRVKPLTTTVSGDAIAGFGLPGGEPIIQLLGTDGERQARVRAGDALSLTLLWRAVAPVPGHYRVHLRLVDALGHVVWSNAQHPVSDMYPTGAWEIGEIVPDWRQAPLSPRLLPGEYTLQVGLFAPFAAAGLEYAGGQTWLTVRQITVEPGSRPKPDHALDVVAPKQWRLLGYDLPAHAPPTGRVSLNLYWEALAPLVDCEIGVRLAVDGQSQAWAWQTPGEGAYPTSRWAPGQRIVTTHLLTMPTLSAPDAAAQVRVQIAVREKGAGKRRVAFYPGWLKAKTTVLALPSLTVSGRPPAAPGTYNFNDHILLAHIELKQETLAPGTPLELAVEWQCLQQMEVDYTLFVQLVAPDGALRGQIDVWPRDGTHPTSAWQEAETIADTYTVQLDADAPPGEYRVDVGWYLLETMQRLPVLDAEGRAIDDKVRIGGVLVGR